MINGSEAREIAKGKRSEEFNKFLKDVEQQILKAANENQFRCAIDISDYNFNSIRYAPEALQQLNYDASFFESEWEQTTYLVVKW